MRPQPAARRTASRRVASRRVTCARCMRPSPSHRNPSSSQCEYQCQSHDSTGGRRPLHGHATWQAAAPQLAPQRHTVATSHGAARPGDVHNQHMHIDASTAKQWSVVVAACVAVQDHKASACTVIFRSAAPLSPSALSAPTVRDAIHNRGTRRQNTILLWRTEDGEPSAYSSATTGWYCCRLDTRR